MVRMFAIAAACFAGLALSSPVFAQQQGEVEAKAMLLRAVAVVKADRTKALDVFNKGEGGFLDRDLYVFCFNAGDGTILAVADPNAKQALGLDERTIKDRTGKTIGMDLYTAAQKPEGQITEIGPYMFLRPSDPKGGPAPKVTFVTRVADLGCGVGYFK
jgi:hypothetical protein